MQPMNTGNTGNEKSRSYIVLQYVHLYLRYRNWFPESIVCLFTYINVRIHDVNFRQPTMMDFIIFILEMAKIGVKFLLETSSRSRNSKSEIISIFFTGRFHRYVGSIRCIRVSLLFRMYARCGFTLTRCLLTRFFKFLVFFLVEVIKNARGFVKFAH